MKTLLLSFAVLCAIACNGEASRSRFPPPSTGPTFPRPPRPPVFRFRREAPEEPQGSITVQGTQPLGGPNRNPSLDINYNHRIIDNDRTRLDAFGGANLHNGRVTPQAGFGVEHRFRNNIFVNGQGQVQPGPRGGLSPSVGAGLGWRFRREALTYQDEALPYEAEEVVEEKVY